MAVEHHGTMLSMMRPVNGAAHTPALAEFLDLQIVRFHVAHMPIRPNKPTTSLSDVNLKVGKGNENSRGVMIRRIFQQERQCNPEVAEVRRR
jgi:hypothetical protein